MPRRRLTRSIRFRVTVVMVVLAIAPLLLAALIISGSTRAGLEAQSIELQHEVASAVGTQLESTLLGLERELALLDQVVGIQRVPPDVLGTLLQNLLASQRMYQDLALLDASGVELARVARDEAVLPGDVADRSDDQAFLAAVERGSTYFGPVRFDQDAREPLTTIGYPLSDRRTGDVAAVLVGDVRFKPMWSILNELDLADGREVFLTTADGHVIAHSNPAVVLSETWYSLPTENGKWTGLSGSEVLVATVDVNLGEQSLTVVAEQPLSLAFAAVNEGILLVALVMAGALIGVVALVVLSNRLFVTPVEQLAASAHRVAEGNLDERASIDTGDEIGDLAEAFNRMVVRLQGLVGELEQRVEERTVDLEAVTQRQTDLIAQLEARNTEMVEIQDRLEQTMRSKDEFLGSVSHELRTPLSSVLGFSTMLLENADGLSDVERNEFCARIADQGQDMANIINDLLVAARGDAGEIVIESRPIDLRDDIEGVVANVSSDRIQVTAPDSPAVALADPGRVRQILRNLIVNADRYGGSSVGVVLGNRNGHVSVKVSDNGRGIPKGEWETIFDPYHRSHHRKGQPASVGLGLTVSRMLARRMDGDLTYEYTGGESVFELLLPRAGVS